MKNILHDIERGGYISFTAKGFRLQTTIPNDLESSYTESHYTRMGVYATLSFITILLHPYSHSYF